MESYVRGAREGCAVANLRKTKVWLCPIFKSPQADMGYDISDYYDIHEGYGTLKDVDDLIQGLHSRGMKCVLDMVLNHTSDEVFSFA